MSRQDIKHGKKGEKHLIKTVRHSSLLNKLPRKKIRATFVLAILRKIATGLPALVVALSVPNTPNVLTQIECHITGVESLSQLLDQCLNVVFIPIPPSTSKLTTNAFCALRLTN